ncbi:MAG: phenylalanine--tRNA ligase subunit beta, partial [Clostridiales bacterium]|nr:phenylalanine--tRNA ligase subunit beta [Clostridiales bacterium]
HGAGVRSINNIVDITNFVMLETGHPMHAFDLDKVKEQKIIVRKALAGEKIVTLDDKEHHLSGTELLICDGQGPTGIAGVMGGVESEITAQTQKVVFECAAFDRANTRLTGRKLGIRTESSGRFEKGVFPETVKEAMDRACQLVNLLEAGEVLEGEIDIYPHPKSPQVIKGNIKEIQHRSGVEIPLEDMVTILEKLYFSVVVEGDTLLVTVPPFRHDLEGAADICEEILRIYGYEHIPSTRLRGEITQGKKSVKMRQKDEIQRILNSIGYFEIMKFSFVSKKSIENVQLNPQDIRNNPIQILNPLGEDTSVMRTTLAPSMLETIGFNQHQGNSWAKLYEVAPVFNSGYMTQEGLPEERPTLVIGAYGEKMDFYQMKGTLLALFKHFGIQATIEEKGEPYHHPGRSATYKVQDEVLAIFGEVHPAVADAFELNQRSYLAEIDLTVMQKAQTRLSEVKALPKYPAVIRDIALVMNESERIGDVLDTMVSKGGKLLENCQLFDVFRGKQLGEGLKSAAFTLTFRSKDHTLTEEEVNKVMNKILQAVEEIHEAKLRG